MLFMEGFTDTLGIKINSSILINNYDKQLLGKIVHIAKKIPGYLSSSSKFVANFHTGMTTMEDFAFILAIYSKEWREKL